MVASANICSSTTSFSFSVFLERASIVPQKQTPQHPERSRLCVSCRRDARCAVARVVLSYCQSVAGVRRMLARSLARATFLKLKKASIFLGIPFGLPRVSGLGSVCLNQISSLILSLEGLSQVACRLSPLSSPTARGPPSPTRAMSQQFLSKYFKRPGDTSDDARATKDTEVKVLMIYICTTAVYR